MQCTSGNAYMSSSLLQCAQAESSRMRTQLISRRLHERTAIKGNFDARDLAPTARVCIATHCVSLVLIQIDALVVARGGDGGVDVELVQDVVGVLPPALRHCKVSVDVRRQHFVVVEMVPASLQAPC
jgi:hypothetical protein